MNKDIFELSNIININLQDSLISTKENRLLMQNTKLPSNTIVLAQINPLQGCVDYNAQKAIEWINWAEKIKAEVIIFPELYLMGYPVGDAIDKFPVIVDDNITCLNNIALKTKNTKVIMGFANKSTTKTGKKYHNSLAVMSNGKIEKIINSSIVTQKSKHNDYKYFEPTPLCEENRFVKIGNMSFALTIGDEIDYSLENQEATDYNTDTIKSILKTKKANAVINCAATITRPGSNQSKNNVFKHISQQYQIAIIHVNQVGSADSYTFEGISRIYNSQGIKIAQAKAFEEQFLITSLIDESEFHNIPQGMEQPLSKTFSLNYENDLERIYLTTLNSIQQYFTKTGFKRAVLGLSGGLDSTVSAVLLADALQPQNVYGISMPSKITSTESKNDAEQLAKNLGINFLEYPIKDIFEFTSKEFNNMFKLIEKDWDVRYKQSFTNDNIQARSRALFLWGIANEFESCLPIATSDKSELYMGYATINGDMSGGFAPLADITKTKLFALADWMNKNRKTPNAIPQTILNKRPGAELAINPKTGKPLLAEEALMPYEFLDEIIWRIENLQQSYEDLLNINFVYERKMQNINPITREQKKEWLEKFFKRMSTALYKASIMPPFPIIDKHSINSIDYRQPIVSSKIRLT